ncbi:hypothetical protein BJV78DRAFT_1195663 [Lactifluus subvellereus]|nr:hypothetical protein BJV78DRAFT_1195663 [Lactifluus subvellereus]
MTRHPPSLYLLVLCYVTVMLVLLSISPVSVCIHHVYSLFYLAVVVLYVGGHHW